MTAASAEGAAQHVGAEGAVMQGSPLDADHASPCGLERARPVKTSLELAPVGAAGRAAAAWSWGRRRRRCRLGGGTKATRRFTRASTVRVKATPFFGV